MERVLVDVTAVTGYVIRESETATPVRVGLGPASPRRSRPVVPTQVRSPGNIGTGNWRHAPARSGTPSVQLRVIGVIEVVIGDDIAGSLHKCQTCTLVRG